MNSSLQPRVSNIELLDFFIELAEKQGKINDGDKVEVNAEVNDYICSTIELAYLHAIHTIQDIGYLLEWANHLNRNKDLRPSDEPPTPERLFKYSFWSGRELSAHEIKDLNTSAYQNILAASFVKTLDLFSVYSDFIHELCFIMMNKDRGITRAEITKAVKLPKKKFEEKLDTIEAQYGFHHLYRDELISLYEARNRYTHSDTKFSPVPRDKRQHKIKWRAHTLMFKRENSSTWITEEKARPFIQAGKMPKAKCKIKFLKEIKTKRFLDDLGRPQITELDIREIGHFFIHIYEEYQFQLIKKTISWGFKPRQVEEYRYKIQISMLGE